MNEIQKEVEKVKEAKNYVGLIHCPNCNSEIAIDKSTIYPIDCSCGCTTYKNGKHAMEYHPINESEWTEEQLREAIKVWNSGKYTYSNDFNTSVTNKKEA